MTRRTKSLPLAGLALLAALAAVSFRSLHESDLAGGEGDAPAVSLPTAIEVILLRAGLDAEAFAAAGLTGAALSAQLAAAAASLGTLPAAMETADTDYATSRTERDRLERLIQSGQGRQEDVNALAQARADLAGAEAARDAVLDDAFEAVTAGLGAGQVATLAQIRANQVWHVPVKYKVAAREQRAWLSIRDCLAHVRTYERHELDPLSEQTDALAAFDEESAVATAASNLATHLAGVQATWDATFVD